MTTRPLSALTMLLSRHTKRRAFISLLGSATVWPLAARAQQGERMRRIGVLTTLAAAMPSSTQPPPSEYFSITPGKEFAANSWIHTPLAPDAPLAPNSAEIVTNFLAHIKSSSTAVYMNDAYPLYIAGPDQPTSRVVVEPHDYDETLAAKARFLQAKMNDVPLPDPDTFAPQYCDEASICDHVAILYQPSSGKYYEFISMDQLKGATTVDSSGKTVKEWRCNWGGRMGTAADVNPSIATNPGWWVRSDLDDPSKGLSEGSSASAIPLMSLLITMGDLYKQSINHPLYMLIRQDQATYATWNMPPAQRTDGASSEPNSIAEGTIFRFPADLDFEKFESTKITDPQGRKHTFRLIAEAIQKYGVVIADTGGTPDIFVEKTDTPQYPVNPQKYLEDQGLWVSYLNFYEDFPWDKLQCLKQHLVQ